MELYNHLLSALEKMEDVFSKQKLQDSWQEEFAALVKDARENSRVLVMGEFNAGKSSFLNALLGQKWLATDVTPATAMATVLQYGDTPSLEAMMKDGGMKQLDFNLLHGISAEGDPKMAELRDEIEYLIVRLPSDVLKTITLVDTPGLNSTHEHHTLATQQFLQRADDVIWLFLYGSIGKMSEIQRIEQIKEYGIFPLGVVNAIDIHYEQTDEDLDELLQREQRKLRPYVRELIGVSSLDAMEGILEDNAEKREWGNFSALTPPLNQMQQLKLHRLMRELIRFLEGFLEQLDELVRMHRPDECGKKLELFLKETIHTHHNHKQQLHKSLSELKDRSQALNLLSNPAASFEELLNELDKADVKTKKDFVQLSNKFKSIKTFHEKNVELYNDYRNETITQHADAVGTGIGRIKQLFTSRKKLQSINRRLVVLEKKREDCENSSEVITSYQAKFGRELSKSAHRLEAEINEKKGQYQEQASKLIDQYNGRIEEVKSAHAEDVRVLELFRFLNPLLLHLEHIRAVSVSAGDMQNEYYINRFVDSLQAIIAQLRSLVPNDPAGDYLAAIRELEEDGSPVIIEGKLPYSLPSNVPQKSDILLYIPPVPGKLTLNTAYLRPYLASLLSLVIVGSLLTTGWSKRDSVMAWIDVLKPAKKVEDVEAAAAEPEPTEPQPVGKATIIAYELNMRSEPDLNAPKVGSVKQGESYVVLMEQNGWFLIGDNAWISGKPDYVSFEPKP